MKTSRNSTPRSSQRRETWSKRKEWFLPGRLEGECSSELQPRKMRNPESCCLCSPWTISWSQTLWASELYNLARWETQEVAVSAVLGRSLNPGLSEPRASTSIVRLASVHEMLYSLLVLICRSHLNCSVTTLTFLPLLFCSNRSRSFSYKLLMHNHEDLCFRMFILCSVQSLA